MEIIRQILSEIIGRTALNTNTNTLKDCFKAQPATRNPSAAEVLTEFLRRRGEEEGEFLEALLKITEDTSVAPEYHESKRAALKDALVDYLQSKRAALKDPLADYLQSVPRENADPLVDYLQSKRAALKDPVAEYYESARRAARDPLVSY